MREKFCFWYCELLGCGSKLAWIGWRWPVRLCVWIGDKLLGKWEDNPRPT